MITTGTRLRELRKEQGLTLEQVGEKLGTSKVTISRYENNVRVPKSAPMKELAKLFNVSMDYLHCFTNERDTSSKEKYVVKDNYIENLKKFIMEEIQLEKDNKPFSQEEMETLFMSLEVGINMILHEK